MSTTPRWAVLFGATIGLLATNACFLGPARIRGGSHSGNATGSLSILTLESPGGEVVVAVKYPKRIDTSWHPGYGHSGNGDDVSQWEELYKVRYKEGKDFVELIVHWEYSRRTRKLTFDGKEFDFPPDMLAILSYDENAKPVCEFLDATTENFDRVKKQFGAKSYDSTPAAPAP